MGSTQKDKGYGKRWGEGGTDPAGIDGQLVYVITSFLMAPPYLYPHPTMAIHFPLRGWIRDVVRR